MWLFLCCRSTLPRMISIPSTLAFGDRLANLSTTSLPSLPSFSGAGLQSQQQPPAYTNGPSPDSSQPMAGPSGATNNAHLVDNSHMTNSAPSTPLTPVSVDQQVMLDPKVEVVNMPQSCAEMDQIQPQQHDFTIHT